MNNTIKSIKIITILVIMCLLIPLIILGCMDNSTTTVPAATTSSASKVSQPQYGGILRMCNLTADGVAIGYPPKLTGAQSNRQAAPCVETLLRSDSSGKPVPWLATGFTENAASKNITLTLRKDVKFHDGTNFNAEAVKWNLEQCMAAKNAATATITSIDIVDDYSVRINFSTWDSTFITSLAQTAGMMISPTACKKNGADWAEKNPVGTGPFLFVSWQRDVKTVYKKFDSYWQKGKPYIDGIEYIIIVDSTTQEMSLRGGELDLLATNEGKPIAGYEKDGFAIVRGGPGSGAMGTVPSSIDKKSPWSNVKVRQAAAYAIDNAALVKACFYGEGEAAKQYVNSKHWAYNPSVTGYPYDPTKAKQLLSEAGFPNGFTTNLYSETDALNRLLFTAAQGYLKVIGIDAQLVLIDKVKKNELVGPKPKGGWDGLAPLRVHPNPDVLVPLTAYYGGKQFVSIDLPEDYLAAVQNGIKAPDFATKQKYAQEAMKLMTDKYCMTIPFVCTNEFAISKNVHNHGILVTPNTAIWTPEDVWMDKK